LLPGWGLRKRTVKHFAATKCLTLKGLPVTAASGAFALPDYTRHEGLFQWKEMLFDPLAVYRRTNLLTS
jgi:hypothetical protein